MNASLQLEIKDNVVDKNGLNRQRKWHFYKKFNIIEQKNKQ